MGKKPNKRELREQEKANKVNHFRQIEEEKKQAETARQERELQEKIEQEAKAFREKLTKKLPDSDVKANSKKHSTAKSNGLKSTFALENGKVLMTSFGNGNDAVIEKLIEGNNVTDYANNLEVKPLEKDFAVKRVKAKKSIIATNPQRKEKIGKDLIDRKDVLEKKYFGKTFDDNIHIQLIYNIMDIEKIMSIYINNILYGLNNVLNRDEIDSADNIGTLNAKTFEQFKTDNKDAYDAFLKNIKKPQLAYFGAAFYEVGFDTTKKGRTERKSDEYIYYILAILSTIRQFLAHEFDRNRKVYDKEKLEELSQVALYTLDEEFDEKYKDNKKEFRKKARTVLDSLYDVRVDSLNDTFLENARKDLTIIFKAYDIVTRDEKEKIIRQYYDFLVRKEYKYQGFSLKRLREYIILVNEEIADKKYNTMRSRLNRLFDFVVYMHYVNNPERKEMLVKKLRENNEDKQKENVYIFEAGILWNSIKDIIKNHILSEMNGQNLASMHTDKEMSELSIHTLKNSTWKAIDKDSSYFSKMIYLMTLFLDGKEINELVTTLINKFENIASFNFVLDSIDKYNEEPSTELINESDQESISKKPEYNEEYAIFAKSKEISAELRVLNSFARMEKPDASSKPIMFAEAAKMLGDKGNVDELTAYYKTLLDKKCPKAQKGFRNFIRNNVVDSLRFKYLIRYCNTKDVTAFARNSALVSFVIKEIPDAQILRYYKSCIEGNASNYDESMRSKLVDIIVNMSIEKLENVHQQVDAGSPEETEKLQKQNIIRLYLAVCYMFFKNLIYVNSRYFLAFYCLERDFSLYGMENPSYGNKFTELTKLFLEENMVRCTPKKKKVWDNDKEWHMETDSSEKHIPSVYLKTNVDNSDGFAIRRFRNYCEHLDVIRESEKYFCDIKDVHSYYEIYHYLLQRKLSDDKDIDNPKTIEYFEKLKEHNSYCKDFVKALCSPFGYNLPRFKNLSIDGLFDMHDKREDRKTGIDD